MRKFSFSLLGLLSLSPWAQAELKLPSVFGPHMVLQQKQADPVWGWDTPGAKVTVTFGGQRKEATAGADGKWMLKLDPMPADAQPKTMIVKGSTEKQIGDVLVGEVWVCAGQSNMVFLLHGEVNGDLQTLAADLPEMRLLRVPNVGTQEIQDDFHGEWEAASPKSAAAFSAVGFYFGKYLQEILHVPVGLIDNAWGGSAVESWIRRETLEKDARWQGIIAEAVKDEAENQTPEAQAAYEKALEQFKERLKGHPERSRQRPPQGPEAYLEGQKRPGNIFAGVVHPLLGYGIKGTIWYQGESNNDHAVEYMELFPFFIEQLRKEWGQGDFPFYWVQLADFKPEQPEPSEGSYAEVREAQTKALRLPNTGQAVIIDLGEGANIHPRNKYSVASRLVRWALVKDYGQELVFRSPEFKSMETHDGQVTVKFDCFGSTLRAFDTEEVRGFAVCGEDKVWHWAKGELKLPDTVVLTCDQVEYPMAVRYAWANNPVCNLCDEQGLPATPFRTDDFPASTKPR